MSAKKEPRKKNRSRLWSIKISLGDCPNEGWGVLTINEVRARVKEALTDLVDNNGAYIVRSSVKLSYDNKKRL